MANSHGDTHTTTVKDVKQLGIWAAICSLGYVFWICGAMEMIERLAFYGVKAVATLYAKAPESEGGLGVDLTTFGVLLAVWAFVQSFLPIFTLEAQEGRLFKPLAFTKTYAMALSALLAITVVPVLMLWFVRGRIVSEARHPVSRVLRFLYSPVLRWSLKWRWPVVILMVVVLAVTLIPLQRIGSEFMPPLREGDVLYMPTTVPGISITEARRVLQTQDKLFRTFPEVQTVFGKIGRAETATDPAPLSMVETTVRSSAATKTLKPTAQRIARGDAVGRR